MKILNFGSCNIDYVYSLDHIVAPGETENTDKMEIFPGGKGLNQSVAIARAGEKVYHAGCIGADGEMLESILKENGVDITYLKKTSEKNGHAIIQVSREGQNSIFLYPGSNAMITKDYIDSVFESFEQGDIVLLQNEINNVDYIVKKAYKKKMCIVLNPSPFNKELSKIDFNMITYIILNEVEAKEISGFENYKESIAYLKREYPELKIMLTLGANGCVYADSKIEIYQPIYKIEAVDTTAAGDTFTGYFIAGILAGDEYAKILKRASAAAALAVSKKGAAPSIPVKEEVDLFLC